MIDYLASFINTDGVAFPLTAAINSTGPSTTDGTEFVKLMIDDEWGARQALMDRVSLTPTGVTETPGTSQVIDAMNLMCCAPGIETGWNLAADPGTTGHRALLLQGQGILRASYPDLDVAVYVGDGNNAAVAAGGGYFYRADDAAGITPNIAGIYLILPDYRGVVERGIDASASIDPDGAGRFLGDVQIDASQGHLHYNGAGNDDTSESIYGGTATEVPGLATGTFTGVVAAPVSQGLTSLPKTDGVNGTPRVSTETRMYNRSVKKVIWY